MWIVAGPNGSGKSSLYTYADLAGWDGSVWIINPDLLTVDIAAGEKLETTPANLAAVERIEAWLNASLNVYQTIGVETVLSSSKYRRLVERAHDRGFQVRMIYVLLRTAELQIERVKLRVQNGGHDVPEDKIRSRRTRSFEQLAWFARTVDRLDIFDNSSGEPELMATKVGTALVWHRRPPAALRAELAAAGVEGLPLARGSAKSRR